MFYACVRAVVAVCLRLFYRVKVNAPGAEPEGPVLFVGNHPNGLIDPALVFILTRRKVTFLAKAPLFRMPVLGWLLKGLDALPVYRKQDDPTKMGGNEGTLDAAKGALVQGRAITIFPEGKSHSEPGLAELKTGASRIALSAAKEGAPVRIVPVGLTYAEKHVFRSEVLIDVGPAIEVATFLPADAASEPDSVRALTERIAEGLRAVTLNLEEWADLPLVQLAEQLFSFKQGGTLDAERLRLWARGVQLFRAQEPERFEDVRTHLASFQRRLALVHAEGPKDLALVYRTGNVVPFVVKNLLALVFGLPLFALGLVLFWLPYQVPRVASRKAELDVQATVKFLTAFVVALVWWAALTVAAGLWGGTFWALPTFLIVPPLALFTLYFAERWDVLLRDIDVFFTLGDRARLKALLLSDGERLAAEVERLAEEYRPKVDATVKR
ncbi:acyltransferase [Myxococcus llanfairpwllgwyngyllgogerychwyrndrobwllllantysiliogogogochensis]|uniref:Acyltransferase n=1 Tax=Myxococcus llanfairpwllgwyngyllgogerychwyrndrobwllllantysiliogogogochensis TaxID=2590453 RepID=A0A540X2E9_9BACT|nr:lysophospholipid acyltransferase family protein [Myxococcus llanfairpwllgwyngyllgogerychwyrndrobwllllantysiliogogogochensis]TQF15442.1 acyltransferase [Myxococcus llanfairpwllgwyngyllgogerychwyrndrobwllllantysiliogogogochensis]